jgi:DNA transformation protein and related proteins
MASKKEYLDFVADWMSPLGEITSRSMMGGYVLYCGGTVFALLANNTLHLKVDEQTRPRFEALGLKPFQPFPDQPGTMQYYPPPAEFFEDADTMAEWGRAAVECGRRAQAKRKPKGAKAKAAKLARSRGPNLIA